MPNTVEQRSNVQDSDDDAVEPGSSLRSERRRATITDVATEAGVSKATVSAVFNGTAHVRDATRQRVLTAAERLDYRPAPRAGAAPMPGTSAPGGDRSIALLIREAENPYYAEVVSGARSVADERGYTLLVTSSEGDYDAERRAVRLLHAKDVDGLMVYPMVDDDADLSHFFELKRRGYPFVLLEGVRGLPTSLVDVDNRGASGTAAQHLISSGHTRIAHFAGPLYSLHSRERVEGVRNACSAGFVRFTDAQVILAGPRVEDGHRAALEYFGSCSPEERPTGVTCYNDMVAAGVLSALAELGLRVPEDVSVVGFDDIPLARYLPTPLTTVRLPKFETGRLATQLLLAQVESRVPVPTERHYLDVELVVRSSTAPPPPGR